MRGKWLLRIFLSICRRRRDDRFVGEMELRISWNANFIDPIFPTGRTRQKRKPETLLIDWQTIQPAKLDSSTGDST
jgi:hypothetical protein